MPEPLTLAEILSTFTRSASAATNSARRTEAVSRIPAVTHHRGNWMADRSYNPGHIVAHEGQNWIFTVFDAESGGTHLDQGRATWEVLVASQAVVPLNDPFVYRAVRAHQLEAYQQRAREARRDNRGPLPPPRTDLNFLTDEECARIWRITPAQPARMPVPPPISRIIDTPETPTRPDSELMRALSSALGRCYRHLGELYDHLADPFEDENERSPFSDAARRVLELALIDDPAVTSADVQVFPSESGQRYRVEVRATIRNEERSVAFSVTPDFLEAAHNLSPTQSLDVSLSGRNAEPVTFRISGTRTGRLSSASPNISSIPRNTAHHENVSAMADRVVADARRRVPRVPARQKTSIKTKASTEVFPWEEV